MPPSPQQATANSCLHQRPDTHRQVWVTLCGVTAPLPCPGAHKALHPPIVCFSPCSACYSKSTSLLRSNLWSFSVPLSQIHRLGNLLWVLELSQQCKNPFGIIVLQFVGHAGGPTVGPTVTSSRRAHATCCVI